MDDNDIEYNKIPYDRASIQTVVAKILERLDKDNPNI